MWLKAPSKLERSEAEKLASSLDRFDKLLVEPGRSFEGFRGRISIVAESGGDVKLLRVSSESELKELEIEASSGKCTAARVEVRDAQGQALAAEASRAGAKYVVVSCPDWKVIPWENLVSKIKGRSVLMAEVSKRQEAELALGALELGVDGLVVDSSNLEEALAIAERSRKASETSIELVPAKVRRTEKVGMGLRACVDTCDLLTEGEGLLIGVQSSFLFLVEGEVRQNPHVEPRPFRVNAGAVSNYVLAPGGVTEYLSELRAGKKVLVASRAGTREAVVGRVKVERRPLVLVEAELRGRLGKIVLQDAETIRLVSPEGSLSVSELDEGSEVLVRQESGGRHFGQRVEAEEIDER
ncbi:MAG: 3-dehydroquinate synthase II [Thermoproteota archaeon]